MYVHTVYTVRSCQTTSINILAQVSNDNSSYCNLTGLIEGLA